MVFVIFKNFRFVEERNRSLVGALKNINSQWFAGVEVSGPASRPNGSNSILAQTQSQSQWN